MKQVTAIMTSPAEDEPQLLAVYAGGSRGNGITHATEILSDEDEYEVKLKRAADADDDGKVCYSIHERYCYDGEWEPWAETDNMIYLQQMELLPVLK